MEKEIAVIHFSKKEYDFLRFMEILDGDNPYYAGLELNHPPTFDECVRHFREHGGEESFRARHILREESGNFS